MTTAKERSDLINDLGLFSEEYDTRNDEMMGNFPQALTHLSHVAAHMALDESDR